jgi:hypothetical protein
MGSTVFKSEADALVSYRNWDFKADHTKVTSDLEAEKGRFCRIAAFLCNKSDFETHLRYVSQRVWERYADIPPDTRNRFTRAISLVAEPLGFRLGDIRAPPSAHAPPAVAPITPPPPGQAMRLKLVAGDPELGYMLRNRLFWKDSMNNRHGEYSHALQWLAVAIKFGSGDASAAYANSGYFMARNAPASSPVYMWQWLADCFPSDLERIATACTANGVDEKICSDSYRTPQIITDYLVRNPRGALKDHFLSSYLHRRYAEREWFATADTGRKKGDLVKLAGDSRAHAETKKAAGGFTNSTRPGATAEARWVRTEDPAAKTKERTVEVEFHGLKGVF